MKKKYYHITIFIICMINLYVCTKLNLLNENLSYLPYIHQNALLWLWTLSCSIYFLYTILKIQKLIQYHHSMITIASYISCILMILSSVIPYEFDHSLHINIACGGTILYMLIYIYLLSKIFKLNILIFQTQITTYILFLSFEATLYILSGCICTAMEVSFVIFHAFHLYKTICLLISHLKQANKYFFH